MQQQDIMLVHVRTNEQTYRETYRAVLRLRVWDSGPYSFLGLSGLMLPCTRLKSGLINKHTVKHTVIYRTGEVRHGYCGTDDEATKLQKAIFLKLKARVTSLVARSAASRMLGYTCELEIKHYHRTFPSTHAHYNSYSLLVPSSTLSGGSF